VERVTIHWPGKDAGTTVLENPAIDKQHTVEQAKK
jgi:hypothetical protein